jgi:RNA polymerase sigma factor (sigma-70 family)
LAYSFNLEEGEHDVSEQPKLWIHRLHELLLCLPDADERERSRVLDEAWPLMHAGLLRQARFQAPKLGRIDRDSLVDLVSEKVLDLLRRIVSGDWDISRHSAPELGSFLSMTAKNAMIDHLRREGRLVHPDADEEGPGWDTARHQPAPKVAAHLEPAGIRAERKEFASHLVDCVDELADRSRTIWFLRVMLEMNSKEIADHPEVDTTPGNVDVILQRTRNAVRDCMTRKGHKPDQMPAGTFTEIWRRFRGMPRPDREKASNDD